MPKVRRIAVSSRVSAAKRASELEATTNIQRNRASAVVISSASPGARCASSSVVPTSCKGMTPTWAPPRVGRASCPRGSRTARRFVRFLGCRRWRGRRAGAAACGCPPGRGFPPEASGSRPRARRPAGPRAPRGSGHRPGSPCRARRAPRAPASAPARRPRARGRSATAAAPRGSPPPARPARAAAPRPRSGHDPAAARARWSARRRRWDRCRPGPPADRHRAATARPAGRSSPASPLPRPPRPRRGGARDGPGSPTEPRSPPAPVFPAADEFPAAAMPAPAPRAGGSTATRQGARAGRHVARTGR